MDEHASPTDDREVPLEAQKVFAELARIVLDQPLGTFPQRVADLATQTLPDVDGLPVTLIEGTDVRPAVFTSRAAARGGVRAVPGRRPERRGRPRRPRRPSASSAR